MMSVTKLQLFVLIATMSATFNCLYVPQWEFDDSRDDSWESQGISDGEDETSSRSLEIDENNKELVNKRFVNRFQILNHIVPKNVKLLNTAVSSRQRGSKLNEKVSKNGNIKNKETEIMDITASTTTTSTTSKMATEKPIAERRSSMQLLASLKRLIKNSAGLNF